MRKLTQRLLIAAALFITVISLSLPAQPVTAADSYCDSMAQTCRSMSQGIYELCIAVGGNPSDCAWNEAQNTISCMASVGCPLHD